MRMENQPIYVAATLGWNFAQFRVFRGQSLIRAIPFAGRVYGEDRFEPVVS